MTIIKRPEMCCCDRQCNAGVYTCLSMLAWIQYAYAIFAILTILFAGPAYSYSSGTILFYIVALILWLVLLFFFMGESCFAIRSCMWICGSQSVMMSKAEAQSRGIILV